MTERFTRSRPYCDDKRHFNTALRSIGPVCLFCVDPFNVHCPTSSPVLSLTYQSTRSSSQSHGGALSHVAMGSGERMSGRLQTPEGSTEWPRVGSTRGSQLLLIKDPFYRLQQGPNTVSCLIAPSGFFPGLSSVCDQRYCCYCY